MHGIIIVLGTGLTLAMPAMAGVQVEGGVRVHRGPAAVPGNDSASPHPGRMRPMAAAEVSRTVVLDRRYGSAPASRRIIRPIGVDSLLMAGGRVTRP